MNPLANLFIIQNAAAAVAASGNNDDDVCPSCNKPEDVVCKCRHCGHEYKFDDDETTGWGLLWWIFGAIVFATLLTMFMSWTLKIDDKGFDRTFVQYVGDQLVYFWKKIVLKLI